MNKIFRGFTILCRLTNTFKTQKAFRKERKALVKN
jgi:hypothetical protein